MQDKGQVTYTPIPLSVRGYRAVVNCCTVRTVRLILNTLGPRKADSPSLNFFQKGRAGKKLTFRSGRCGCWAGPRRTTWLRNNSSHSLFFPATYKYQVHYKTQHWAGTGFGFVKRVRLGQARRFGLAYLSRS